MPPPKPETFERRARFENADQVEMKNEWLEYFYKHIADKDLNAELLTETNISIHFADLYVAADALFGGDADAKARYVSDLADTRVSVEKMQNYIRHEDLAAKKERNIRSLFGTIIELGNEFLKGEAKSAIDAMQSLNAEIHENQKKVDDNTRQKEVFETELANFNEELRKTDARPNLLMTLNCNPLSRPFSHLVPVANLTLLMMRSFVSYAKRYTTLGKMDGWDFEISKTSAG